jgi:hypothetical protein
VLFYAPLLLPIIAAVGAMIGLFLTGARLWFAGSLIFLTAALGIWGYYDWFLRDGLGPDSVESRGFEAIANFADAFWIHLVGWVFLVALSFWLARRKARLIVKTRGSTTA